LRKQRRYGNLRLKAEEEYKIARKLDPGYMPAHVGLALLYYQMGRKRDALSAGKRFSGC